MSDSTSVHPNMLKGLRAGWAKRWPQRTLMERVWEKIDVRGPDDCWEWRAGLNASGYGQINICRGRSRIAHRLVYEHHHGVSLKTEEHACHRCDNRKCCNPAHIWIGSNADNVRDRVQKARSARETSRSSKLTWAAVRQIRRLIEDGFTNTAIARAYGVKQHTISTIKTGVHWPVHAEPMGR